MEYSIYRLFGSKTRTALLAELVMNQSKSYHVLELSRRLGIPHSMLVKEINNLERLDIVRAERIGKLKLVRINTALPYFRALKDLMLKTAGLKDLMRDKLSKFKSRIKYCLIYGSFAKGEEAAESDIDVLIIGRIKMLELAKPFRELEDKLGREVHYVVWSEEQLSKRAGSKSTFLLDIISNQVIMVMGSEDEFRKDAEGTPHQESAL